MLKPTPSQTVGPYLHIGMDRDKTQNIMVTQATDGDHITIKGCVLDAKHSPVGDAVVELWQANAQGRYNHPEDDQDKPLDDGFSGFGRCATNAKGEFTFQTIKPGQVPGRGNALQAPHINVNVFARGMLIHATTRLYFSDETSNETDPLLTSIEDESRRLTLIAERTCASGHTLYNFDIHLDGPDETAFFDA